MTTKERFERMYAHREADRVPILDSPWPETIRRWEAEGMKGDYIDYFDLDKTAYISTNNSPNYPKQILKENDEYIIQTTAWGATTKTFKNRTTTPEDLNFAYSTPDEWMKAKERMTFDPARIPWDKLKANYRTWREEGRWITGGLWFGFDVTHSRMVGTENLLIAMIEEPEWVMDMFDTELTLSIRLLEQVWDAGYTFDEVHWYDDMGYKGTQFFSMDAYRSLLKPYHQRAIDWGHAHGCKVRLHSCGNIMPLVPELADMGLDGLNPLEVKAGMRPAELKERFGDRLVFHGGVNAAYWGEKEKILPQIEELVPVMKKDGGYIFASDHSIPPYVSLEDFASIIDTVKKVGSYE